MSNKGGPIKVRLVPDPNMRGGLLLGPISLCREASTWLRETFPQGGTLRGAWDACPQVEWLAYVANMARIQANERTGCLGPCCINVETADEYRSKIAFERVEGWLAEIIG